MYVTKYDYVIMQRGILFLFLLWQHVWLCDLWFQSCHSV